MDEYSPAAQLLHTVYPDEALNLPAAHTPHCPPWAPVYPRLQMQLTSAGLPAGASEFSGQPKHVTSVVAPSKVEYVSGLHLVHAKEPLYSLYFPAKQMLHCGP